MTDKAISGLGNMYLYISYSSSVYPMIQEPRLQENQELRKQENRGIIMILYSLVKKVMRLATSSS